MSGGLVALLDDIAAIAKLAAASLDDIGAAAGRASAKAVGVVIDDTAVTPRYVTGFRPERELPIIWRIARGSLKNKLLFITPVALLLSQVAPWAMTPLLMLGGAYLCYEGAEKVWELFGGGHHSTEQTAEALGNREHEEQMIAGAIRTDFILSAEIMAIALAEVAAQPLGWRALILVVVALLITAFVYGLVALIVKMDDVGLRLAQSQTASGSTQALGRALVRGMPKLLSFLSVLGTAAMVWVGGHIIIAGLDKLGVHAPYQWLHHLQEVAAHALPFAAGLVSWLVDTVVSGLVGLLLGALIVAVLHLRPKAH